MGRKKIVGGAPKISSWTDSAREYLDKFWTNGSMRKELYRNFFVIVIFILVCIFIVRVLSTPDSAAYNVDKYFFYIAIPLVFIFAVMLNRGNFSYATVASIVGICILGFLLLVYIYMRVSPTVLHIFGYSKYLVLAFIILFGLGILYKFGNTYLDKWSEQTTWLAFYIKMMFYIPCMLYDGMIYLIKDWQLTPYSAHIALIVELLVIMLYIYLPNISNDITGLRKGKQLLTDVYFLNNGVKPLAFAPDLSINNPHPQGTDETAPYVGRTNYAISMWIYTNPQPPSSSAYNQESEIFTYGYTDFSSKIQYVKPMIRYYGGGAVDAVGNPQDLPAERNKLVFYFYQYPPVNQYEDASHTFYNVTVPNQTWNQIVLNYRNNEVDLFINGALERTFEMTEFLPKYDVTDSITIGSSNKGLDGAICNVAYYPYPLTLEQVVFSYNTFAGANPPVPRNSEKTPWEKELVEIVIV
jgi:hypothetical protein